MTRTVTAITAAMAILFSTTAIAQPSSNFGLTLELMGTCGPQGPFDEGVSEIVAFDPDTERLFSVNADAATVDVIDLSDPDNPGCDEDTIDVSGLGAVANSIAVKDGFLAVAIENAVQTDPGVVGFYDTSTLLLENSVAVGALPDMLTFTPDGDYVLVANEGQPNDDYTTDPVGSISIIDVSGGVASASVSTASFSAYNGQEDALRALGVRIFGPGANAAEDFEPEYITVSSDSETAWAILQENNALVEIDIASATVTELFPLGYKDHNHPQNALDPSDEDDGINIGRWPVRGFYMPDAIAAFAVDGQEYIVSANEGDSRDYDGFSEEERVEDIDLDPFVFPNWMDLQEEENLGRLKITTTNGNTDADPAFEALYSYGARSFSIWDTSGELVYDSGSDFEDITAAMEPSNFNSDNGENDSFDDRSDDKGPEPEGIALGEIDGRTFAFMGLERIGGIMIYDITNPKRPRFVSYNNHRNFGVDAQLEDDSTNPAVLDLGPEGLVFISESDSPSGEPLLAIGNEISGTTSVYKIIVEQGGRFRSPNF